MEQQYKVVFPVTANTEANDEQVRHRVGRLLQISQTDCDRLFNSTTEVTLKKRVSLEQAEKLQHMIVKAGAFCEVRRCPSLKLDHTATPTRNREFICPACSHHEILEASQQKPDICPICGTNIPEYKRYKKTRQEKDAIQGNLKRLKRKELKEKITPHPLAHQLSTKPTTNNSLFMATGLILVVAGISLLAYLVLGI